MADRILVPLDGSRLAEQALSCAITLGHGLPAELVLFRAFSIPSDVQEALDRAGLKAEPLIAHLETEANDYLEAMNQLLPETALHITHAVRQGPAADAILDFVEETDIHMIVMASHGYTGIRRWRHGSVAMRLLQSARVPVLVVRAKEKASRALPAMRPCRRILVPLDGSEVAEQVLPVATTVARALGCQMTLFQAHTMYVSSSFMGELPFPLQHSSSSSDLGDSPYLQQVADALKEQGIRATTAASFGAVADSIVKYAEANDMDLIAMCTHGRTGIARWALGSVASRVLSAADKPILLVRAR